MGGDSFSYAGAYLGFAINSGKVLDYGHKEYSSMVHPEDRYEIAQKLDKKFKNFLKRKFDVSIPEDFSKMEFVLDYDALIADNDASSYDFPTLVFGYAMTNFVGKTKSLDSIKEIKCIFNFPENCADILAEFLAVNKLINGRENKKVKYYENSDESDGSNESSDDSDESSDEAFPQSEINNLKSTLLSGISFDLHGFVH